MQMFESWDWSVLPSLIDAISPLAAVFIMALAVVGVSFYALHVVLKVILEVKK